MPTTAMTRSLQRVLALLLLASLAAAQTSVPPDSILRIIPEDCSAFAYCDSPANMRARVESNDWFKIMGGETGDFLFDDLESGYSSSFALDLGRVLPIAHSLRGETVLFASPSAVSLFARAPEPRTEASEAMRSFLPAEGPERPRKRIKVTDADVELVAWPDGMGNRQGHFAAYVEHPLAIGLVSADDLETLMASLTESIKRLGSSELGPTVRAFELARKSAVSTRGIEFYANFSRSAQEAEEALERSFEGVLPSPKGMLGIEQGTWLHANLDFHGGLRIDCNAKLHIPKQTLLASLADTFGTLPADLPARLPRDLASLWSLRWDVSEFYNRMRKAIVEHHGEKSLEIVDSGLLAAKSMTGADPMQEFVAPLDGTFAFFFKPFPEDAGAEEGIFSSFGFLFGLRNGESFLEACELLIEATMESFLELNDRDGADVYTVIEHEWNDMLPDATPGGVAFLAREFLFSLNGDLLREHVDAIHQKEGKSLADSGQLAHILDQHSGATWVAAAQMDWFYRLRFLDGSTPPDSHTTPEGRALLQPFLAAFAFAHARRTSDGFSFRFELR